jgi:hypothetical protein
MKIKIITESKRRATVLQWSEIISKHMKRANASAECFYRFSGTDDLDRLIEDCEQIIKAAQNTKEAINYMDLHNIE